MGAIEMDKFDDMRGVEKDKEQFTLVDFLTAFITFKINLN